MKLAGNPEQDLRYLSTLDDNSLLTFCLNSKEKSYENSLCEDENLWKDRIYKKYGEIKKNPKRTWRNLFIKISFYDQYPTEEAIEKISEAGDKNLDLMSFFMKYKGNEIERLYLSNKNLTQIPKEIGYLYNLRILKMDNNELTEVPRELKNLISLKELDLSSNKLTEVPRELGNIPHLEVLKLDDNKLVELPKELGNLYNLKILDLRYNNLKEIPKTIEKIPRLKIYF